MELSTLESRLMILVQSPREGADTPAFPLVSPPRVSSEIDVKMTGCDAVPAMSSVPSIIQIQVRIRRLHDLSGGDRQPSPFGHRHVVVESIDDIRIIPNKVFATVPEST